MISIAFGLAFSLCCDRDRGEEKVKETTYVLKVEGMKCDKCATKVSKAIKSLQGVKDASVALKAGRASVIAPSTLDPKKLEEAVKSAGFTPTLTVPLVFEVRDMVCGGCANKVTKAVLGLKDVVSVEPDVSKRLCTVYVVPKEIKADSIAEAITKSGLEANEKK